MCIPGPSALCTSYVSCGFIQANCGLDMIEIYVNEIITMNLMESFAGGSDAGVASDGKRAVIVGGWTNARKGAHKLPFWWLADVWEFHFDLGCWIQVRTARGTCLHFFSGFGQVLSLP